MADVVALGELLIDFTPAGLSDQGNVLFERNPGGAPANVLVALTRLGGTGAFIGKVGEDAFGNFLLDTLKKNGVDPSGLKRNASVPTTLAFVHLSDTGDRSFSFYRNPGADWLLSYEDIDLDLIRNARVFHFGSVSMTHEPSRTATMKAVQFAKESGRIVSYDPNYRPALWQSPDEARKVMIEGMAYADILKISGEELEFLTGVNDLDEGVNSLLKHYNGKVLLITLGAHGCFFGMNGQYDRLPAYPVHTIDTTGAGDAFLGGFLYQITQRNYPFSEITFVQLKEYVDFANAVGSLATTKKGAIPAMPQLKTVQNCMRNL